MYKTQEFWSENEAKRANKHANKRIIYWPPFWNKVYVFEQFRVTINNPLNDVIQNGLKGLVFKGGVVVFDFRPLLFCPPTTATHGIQVLLVCERRLLLFMQLTLQ